MRVATLTAGYGDGYLRAASNRAQVLLRGKRCDVLGRVTMDQMVVDVSRVAGARAGDEAVLIGRQARDEIPVHMSPISAKMRDESLSEDERKKYMDEYTAFQNGPMWASWRDAEITECREILEKAAAQKRAPNFKAVAVPSPASSQPQAPAGRPTTAQPQPPAARPAAAAAGGTRKA